MELFALVVTISVVIIALFPNDSISFSKIVGGVNSGINEFPYQVSLRWNYHRAVFKQQTQHICGGSILTANWVLTAAHCNVRLSIAGMLEVMAGEVDFENEQTDNSRRQVRTINKLFNHEQYVMNAIKLNPYDIAVGQLNAPFFLNQFVSAINLPIKDSIPTGFAILSGWGSISKNTTVIQPQVLQRAEIPIINLDQCKGFYGNSAIVDESNVCAGELSGDRSACIGDSGGPLVQIVTGIVTQIGIVSYGAVPCGQENSPGVFTKVSFYIDWITTSINSL